MVNELKKIAPVRGVYGNIDGMDIRQEFPEYQVFVSGGMRVLLIHIGGYPGKYESKVRQIIYQQQPNIFACGHSHILKVMHDPKYNVLHINPGAAGNSGFHRVKTAIKFNIDSGNITDMKIMEIDRKK